MFLEGRTSELEHRLTERMESAAEEMQFEAAARLRDQIVTVHQMQDKQRIATADNEDADVFGFHYENEMLAVNLFHMRGGKIVDRRDFFWEELPEFLDTNLNENCEVEASPALEPDPMLPAPEVCEAADVTQHASVTGLGGTFSAGRVLFGAAEAALPRPGVCAAIGVCAGRVSRSRGAYGVAVGAGEASH